MEWRRLGLPKNITLRRCHWPYKVCRVQITLQHRPQAERSSYLPQIPQLLVFPFSLARRLASTLVIHVWKCGRVRHVPGMRGGLGISGRDVPLQVAKRHRGTCLPEVELGKRSARQNLVPLM